MFSHVEQYGLDSGPALMWPRGIHDGDANPRREGRRRAKAVVPIADAPLGVELRPSSAARGPVRFPFRLSRALSLGRYPMRYPWGGGGGGGGGV